VSASKNKEDLSKYMTVAWVLHPDLIPIKVGCVVSEPVQPSVMGQPPVFLHMSEIMNTKCDTLQHRVFIQVIEVHDFNLPEGDSSGDSGLDSNDSDADGAPGFSSVTSSLRPWPRIYRFMRAANPSSAPCPSLPCHGGMVAWLKAASTTGSDTG
jgi:hypothetical protein